MPSLEFLDTLLAIVKASGAHPSVLHVAILIHFNIVLRFQSRLIILNDLWFCILLGEETLYEFSRISIHPWFYAIRQSEQVLNWFSIHYWQKRPLNPVEKKGSFWKFLEITYDVRNGQLVSIITL